MGLGWLDIGLAVGLYTLTWLCDREQTNARRADHHVTLGAR